MVTATHQLDTPEAGTAVGPAVAAAGLSAEQVQAIGEARRGARKINRAAMVAAVSGWTMAVFSGLSLLGGLFSLRALLLGIGLAVVAIIELRGSKGFRRFDLATPRRLGLNQLAVALLVVGYAGWGIVAAVTGPGPYDEHLAAGGQVAEMLAPIDRLTRVVTVATYAAVIAGSLIGQACASAYYLTRRGHMLAYVRKTPAWLVETLRAAA